MRNVIRQMRLKRDKICNCVQYSGGMELLSRVEDIVSINNNMICGVADISYSEFGEIYSSAIVIAQKYSKFISNEKYDETSYHQLLIDDRTNIDNTINFLKGLFDEYGIRNYIPSSSQTDELSLVAPFSFKYAAVQAGLGWIGKSGVLVTRAFGPRVRLAVILVDYLFETGCPTVESLCGDCHECVDACPWKVIKGANWDISTKREQILDFQLCNSKRSEFIENNGRKHTCGYCILACPWGK